MSGGMASGGEGGIIQIMAASGAKASYAPGDRDYIAASGFAPNYLSLFADSGRLTVAAYDSEHKVVDSVELLR